MMMMMMMMMMRMKGKMQISAEASLADVTPGSTLLSLSKPPTRADPVDGDDHHNHDDGVDSGVHDDACSSSSSSAWC